MNDSLRKRYFTKLLSNFISAFISFFTQLIIPRGLGPQNYGNFNFLVAFFTQIKGFCETGTSLGFYTKLSQRAKEFSLVAFYFYFISIVSLAITGFVLFIHLAGLTNKFWPGQDLIYVYLAVGLVIFTWVTQTMDQMNDAYGLTVLSEITKIIQKITGLLFIAVLFYSNKITLKSIFYYNYAIASLLIFLFILILKRHVFTPHYSWRLPLSKVKGYFSEFYQYSHPLFTYSLIGLFVGILDRWLLQVFAGSIQQGFFSLSFQIGAICFLFSGAMTPLITREFSIAYAKKDFSQMALLFRKHIPLLYAITAFLSCFVAANADKVTLIMGGGKFKEAAVAVAIMAFYPIHQTYGQLSNAIYFATGQTKLYRNIGIIFNLASLPFAYFLIAPKEYFGINAGANGLAFKLVIINVLLVNAQLYFNARFLKLSFIWYLWHQILCLISLLALARGSAYAVTYFFGSQSNVILGILLSGFCYFILTAFFVYLCPYILGLERKNLFNFWDVAVEKILKIKKCKS